MKKELILYNNLLSEIKNRVRIGQIRANLSANAEMLAAYWDIGKMIYERQKQEGWGKGIIPRLAKDLKNELPEQKGFSVRNIQMIVQFYSEYNEFDSITQRPVAQLNKNSNSPLPVAKIDNKARKKSSLVNLIALIRH